MNETELLKPIRELIAEWRKNDDLGRFLPEKGLLGVCADELTALLPGLDKSLKEREIMECGHARKYWTPVRTVNCMSGDGPEHECTLCRKQEQAVHVAVQTEQEMHNAWRKRAEEAERDLKAAVHAAYERCRKEGADHGFFGPFREWIDADKDGKAALEQAVHAAANEAYGRCWSAFTWDLKPQELRDLFFEWAKNERKLAGEG